MMTSSFYRLPAGIRTLCATLFIGLLTPILGEVCTNCPPSPGGGSILIDAGACCATSTNATLLVDSTWGIATLHFVPNQCWKVTGVNWSAEGDGAVLRVVPTCDEGVTNCWQAWLIPGTRNGTVQVIADVYLECPTAAGTTKRVEMPVEVCGGEEEGGAGSGGGGCSSCQGPPGRSSPTLGTLRVGLENGPRLGWPLGAGNAEGDAGVLTLWGDASVTNLAAASRLTLPYHRPGVSRYPVSGTIQQVKSPQGMVQVLSGTNAFDLQFFYAKDVSGPNTNGSYWTNGPGPFAWWRVEKPAAAGTNNWLSVADLVGNRTYLYAYQAVSNQWFLTNGTRVDVSWETTTGSATNLYHEVWGGGQLWSRVWKRYDYDGGYRLLKWVEEGDGSVTKRTTYSYSAAALPELVTYPDGRWEYLLYDNERRLSYRFEPYGNVEPPAGSMPSSQDCKVTEYSYAIDNGMPSDDPYIKHQPLRIITWIKEVETAREYRRPLLGFLEIQRCRTPGADWDAADNVKEFTQYALATSVSSGFTQYTVLPRPTAIRRANGTYSLFTYADGPSTFTVQEASGETIQTNGTLQVWNGVLGQTVYNTLGRLVSRSSWPIQEGQAKTNILEQESYSYQSGGQYFDDLQRGHNLTHFTQGGGSRTSQSRYACCGLDYTVDPDGIRTEYEYDEFGRLRATRRLVDVIGGTNYFLRTESNFDPAGRVLSRVRHGTDGSWIYLERNGYDILGRLVAQTNALEGVTTFSEGIEDDRLKRTTTYHDGGTRLEHYYRDGRLEKVTGTAVQPVRWAYGVEASPTNTYYQREFTHEIKLDASFQDTGEWTQTYRDGLGQVIAVVYPDNAVQRSWHNNLGQLIQQADADGVTNLFRYNGEGGLEFSVADLNADGTNDLAGSDRVTRTVDDVYGNGSKDVRRTCVYVWPTNSSNSAVLISTTEASTDGLTTWQRLHAGGSTLTTLTERSLASNGVYTVTVSRPDGTQTVSAYRYGRLVSVTRKDSGGGTTGQTTYSYDAHGRQATITDARNGTTTYAFNAADQVTTITSPDLGDGSAPQASVTDYDAMGRAWRVTHPDGTSVTNSYHPNGLLAQTSGSRTYPVGYGYDAQGRLTTMTNWSAFPSTGARVTQWFYDGSRGWLTKKLQAGESSDSSPDYDYTPTGRLWHRYWERGTNTTYSYNAAGDLRTVVYSDSTPAVTNTYDRRGRLSTTVCANMTTTRYYDNQNQLLGEVYSAGTLGGLTVTNILDGNLRRQTVALKTTGGTTLASQTFGYDTTSRLTSVSDGTNSATYAYLANSSLLDTVTFKQNGVTRMTTTRQFDKLSRLQSISSILAGTNQLPVSSAYVYNAANQRTRNTLADGSFWVYEYDALGQVKSGKRYWNDGTPVAGQQFEYGFDDIGNRTSTKAGGDESGANLRSATYTATLLNQYTNRTVLGAFDVLGIANATNSVLVNGSSSGVYRKGEYFRKELSVNNTNAIWQNVSVTTSGGGSSSGNAFVPATPEVFVHDADGNLTQDGRFTYTWDAENRLTKVESLAGAPQASKRKVTWEFDAQGRRIRQTTYDGSSGTYVATEDVRFLADGWRHVAELAYGSNTVWRAYAWGLDLGGSLDAAGGVGGLLWMSSATNGTHFAAYDGNGNVTALAMASDGTVSATYEYGPFGEVIRATGPAAKENPLRFSTKRANDTGDLVLYEYRAYSPSPGRWLSRDPMGERGGIGLYTFVQNQPPNAVDVFGRRMELVVTEQLASIQVDPNTWGETYWAVFRVETGVFRQPGTTCWRIQFTGLGHLHFWYVPGPGPFGISPAQHEAQHAWIDYDMFKGYNDGGDYFVRESALGCFSAAKAQCYAKLIAHELRAAWSAWRKWQNSDWDCRETHASKACADAAAGAIEHGTAYLAYVSRMWLCGLVPDGMIQPVRRSVQDFVPPVY